MPRKKSSKRRRPELLVRFIDITAVSAGISLRLHGGLRRGRARREAVVLCPLAGAVLGELSVHRQWRRAAGVGVAAWIGFLIGTVVKVGLAFAMIAIFLTALFWR